MSSQNTIAEAVLRRDRWIAVAGLAILTILSWLFVLGGAGTGMSVMKMTTWSFPPPLKPAMARAWDLSYWGVMVTMWWIMMIAMMTPSAAPMVLLYARTSRHAQRKGRMASGVLPTGIFLAGYLIAWLAFSIIATGLQWGLEQLGLVHSMEMWSINQRLSGVLLVGAGLYQLSPLKHICLEHCRSPAEYLSRHWRDGRLGAFRMGAEHGAYCLGCCWVLMALLFVGGAMNLVWIAGLSIIVLTEKIAPFGHRIAQALGLVMMMSGTWLIAT